LRFSNAYALNDRSDEARKLVERYVAWSHSTGCGDAVAEILAELGGEPAVED
jgi:hypothetical protein